MYDCTLFTATSSNLRTVRRSKDLHTTSLILITKSFTSRS